MHKNTLHNNAPSKTIEMPYYSGHRQAWITPATQAAPLRRRKIGRWILAAALAAGWAWAKGGW